MASARGVEPGSEPQKAQKTQKGLVRVMDWPPASFPFCDLLCSLWLLLCSLRDKLPSRT